MNTRTAIDHSKSPRAHHVTFNNDRQYFSVALENGFAIYTSETCELYMEQEQEQRIRMAVMLESSQIVGLLTRRWNLERDGDRLTLWDVTKRQEVASVATPGAILRVCLTKSHILLIFERNVALYKHQPTLEKIATYETARNILGLGCLGARMLVIPGRSAGQIQLLNVTDLNVSIIPAHTSPLRALELSPNEGIIASASDKGTLVRLYSTATCGRIGELRRGITLATIFSLAISPSNTRLAVTSDTNTLHIFELPVQPVGSDRSRKGPSSSVEGGWQKVEPPPSNVDNVEQGGFLKWGNLSKLPFTPRIVTDVYSFASVTFDPGRDEVVDTTAGRDDLKSPSHPEHTPKGIAGWINDETVVVISGGSDARYERFALAQDGLGKTVCIRVGRSRYMVPN